MTHQTDAKMALDIIRNMHIYDRRSVGDPEAANVHLVLSCHRTPEEAAKVLDLIWKTCSAALEAQTDNDDIPHEYNSGTPAFLAKNKMPERIWATPCTASDGSTYYEAEDISQSGTQEYIRADMVKNDDYWSIVRRHFGLDKPNIRDGFVMVPVEPTDAMMDAYFDLKTGHISLGEDVCRLRWQAMIAAAQEVVK